ncbi:MAG: 2-C-methyl-D-erythritol 4-phosphate cytidylyltransferase [Ruminococcaceae bacterium]|nr:2-C-methyl-D-erythritol 4-phosphate cytidylyltransferase [Oscillospiraceae bacterium]
MPISRYTRAIRRFLPLDYCGAVIVAAGNATRMGGIDKAMALLGGEPVIVRTVRAFQDCEAIKEIVIVTRSDLLMQVSDLCHKFPKVTAVVVGGENRVESVQNGLNALSGKVRLAAIHDGARPLVSYEVIDRTVRAAHTYGAAAPGIPVKNTIKVVSGGLVASTPDRKTLQAVQTPQVFDFDILRGALKKAVKDGAEITDDCSAVERMKMRVRMVEGEERNIKITTPMDLKIAEMLLEERK